MGYGGPLTSFVGRYLDSSITRDYQFYFRTARARGTKIAADRNRIYMMIGSAVAAYDLNTFFTRLANGETLFASTSVRVSPSNTRAGDSERFLLWDKYFYAENQPAGYPDRWVTRAGDGQVRLFNFDYDDRGYVYVATGAYGWGIVKDDGGHDAELMPSMIQYFSQRIPADDDDPNQAVSIKSNGAYYLITGGDYKTNVFNVTNPASPVRVRDFPRRVFKIYAKNSGGTRIAISNGGLQVYTNDDILQLANPLLTVPGSFFSIASDGANFFATSSDSNDFLVITVVAANGNGGYTVNSYSTNTLARNGANISAGGGFLAVAGADHSSYSGNNNARLYKLSSNLVPTEVPLDGYVAKHYTAAAPSGYTYPDYSILSGAYPVKVGSKVYLIVENFGLGDVYEVRAGNSLTPSIKSKGRTPNPSSKAPANSGPYYGDEITFTSVSSQSPAPPVSWDFGDGVPHLSQASDIAYQFSGLSASSLPATRTVKATSATDPDVSGAVNVTLAKPQVRIGINGTSYVFTSGGAVENPIVSSDQFVDASDGAVEGHFSEWAINSATAAVKALPNEPVSVGPVGARSVTLTGHYGVYVGSGANLMPYATDAPFSVGPVTYTVRPFAAAINGPLACTNQNCSQASAPDNVGFKSATRATTIASDLTGGASAQVNYSWQLLKPDGNNGLTDAGLSATGQSSISAVPDFFVPRTTFQNASGWRVRLTLTLVTPAAVPSSEFATSSALSVPLTGPSATGITRTGCENVGGPCAFNVATGQETSGWTYAWSVSGPATVSGSTAAQFQPRLTVAGTYTVSVKISNAIGDATVSTQPFVVAAPVCASAPTNDTMAISFIGRTSNCVDTFSSCNVSEAVEFAVTPFGWSTGNCDKYTWDFGDNTPTSSLVTPTHAYSSAGTFTVKVTVEGGLSTGTTTKTIKVGAVTPPPPLCANMSPGANVFIALSGATSRCSALSNTCDQNEDISFQASSFGYNFGCATHSFSWNFGDGTTATGQYPPAKRYSNAGPVTVSLTVSNGSQTITTTQPLTIRGSGPLPGNCPTMVADSNVYITWIGPTSGCTTGNGECKPAENIAFAAGSYQYSYSCAPHTYLWNFGDGQTSTEQNPRHTYATPSTYNVTLTISNNGQTLTMQKPLKMSGGNNCPTMVPGANVYMLLAGASTNCNTIGSSCNEGEAIQFSASSYQYNYSCSPHTYHWSFGDGQSADGASVAHSYATPGKYTVSLRITNSAQEVTQKQTVEILSTGPTKRRASRH